MVFPTPQWWPEIGVTGRPKMFRSDFVDRHHSRQSAVSPPVFPVFPTFGQATLLLPLVAGAPYEGLVCGAFPTTQRASIRSTSPPRPHASTLHAYPSFHHPPLRPAFASPAFCIVGFGVDASPFVFWWLACSGLRPSPFGPASHRLPFGYRRLLDKNRTDILFWV